MTTVETLQDLARSHIQIHAKGTGGNTKFTCEHCGKQFTGSLTRQLAHLVGDSGNGIAACQDISDDIREGIKIEKGSLERAAQSGSKRTLNNSGSGSTQETPAKRLRQPTIAETLADKRATDLVVAEFFYGTGLPLHLVRSPLFKKMCEVISSSSVTYRGPAYNAMRTVLLQAVKDRVESSCEDWLEHAMKITGFALASDGWTDAQGRPLLNFLLCTPRGTKFMRALDTSGNEKNGDYIADKMSEVIDEVGAEYISVVIMDGAASNVAASEVLEDRYPSLFTLHCTAHALDLALEKICELPYFSEPVSVSKRVIAILTNHHFTSALFKTHSKLFLLKPGDTRFYSAYIAVRRLSRCQSAVLKTVVSDEWAEWAAKRDYKDKARFVSKAVKDDGFWTALANFCVVLKPLVRLLRLVDSNMPSLSKVYPECCEIAAHIEKTKLPADVKKDVAEIFRERWDKMHSPLHSVGYMLEPQFQTTNFGTEVRSDFREALRKLVPASDYIAVLSQHTKFTNKEGIFGNADIMMLTQPSSEHMIPTYQFWHEHGYETPELARVAQRVTSMTSSAGACERNWSAYDFIHSKKRNKLTPDRANDLVFVFSNLRLMAKFKEPEKFAEWVEEIDEEQQEALLGLEGDEEFVPAYEMQDAADSDAEEMSDDE